MIAGRHAARQARIDGLTEVWDTMDGCIGCGCRSDDDGPLRPSDDASGI